jgi:hypothetical protein
MKKVIVIAGAGAAGLACAISASKVKDTTVFLVEKTARLGGTVTQSLIHTIGGLYDTNGEYINRGLPVELTQRLLQASSYTRKRKMGKLWVLNVEPAIYEKVVEAWIKNQSNIQVFRNSQITLVQVANGLVNQIKWVTNDSEKINLRPWALVDATGAAEIVRMINPQWVNEGRALAGLIFQMRGVETKALKFPNNVGLLRTIKKATEDGILPTECAMTWFDTGIYEDEMYIKLNISMSTHNVSYLENVLDKLADFLREFPAFSKAKVEQVGILGIRDSGRIKGKYCLTKKEVKNGQCFYDAVCRCGWPIEYWDPQKGVTLDYLPSEHHYEIPLRSLQVTEMKNLWAVGKCLSADELAQASARVAGTCWAMGDGLGKVITEYQN